MSTSEKKQRSKKFPRNVDMSNLGEFYGAMLEDDGCRREEMEIPYFVGEDNKLRPREAL